MVLVLGFKRLVNFITLVSCILLFWGAFYGGLISDPSVRSFIEVFILCYLSIAMIRQIFLFIGTVLYRAKQKIMKQTKLEYEPMVSILVPAYNEAAVIGVALESLLKIEYKNFEIIIIDDGSTDTTAAAAFETINRHPNKSVKLVTQPNGGKANALNHGITIAQGDIVVCVDADSRLTPDALSSAVKHFLDPRVAAVSGFIRVANLTNWWVRFQDLEYAITLNFNRPALALTGSVTIVPGPAGMFRKSALQEMGGYGDSPDIFAEDADLTVRLLTNNWLVTSEDSLLSFTEAPDTLIDILRQRYRWNRGIIQALLTNFLPLIYGKNIRGKVIALYLLLDAFGIRIVNFALTLYFLGNFYSTGEVSLFTKWFLVLIALDGVVVSFTASSIKEFSSNLITMMLSRFSYSFILMSWGVLCLIDECLETKMSWDKLDRLGNLGGST